MKLRFITSTPQNILEGSGTYAGVSTLRRALEAMGVEVVLEAPAGHWPSLTLQRLWFNQRLRVRAGYDATIGFDMDGYTIAAHSPVAHVASVKGVIADEALHEEGVTRALLGIQARCEQLHVRRADFIMTTSRSAAERIRELYSIPEVHSIVPELIDLDSWSGLLGRAEFPPGAPRFRVLCVCRFYPRKRLDVLLRAAARLRERIRELEVRIVGGGPQEAQLKRLTAELGLGGVVRWLGSVSREALAAEYKSADLFCLPSVQEGFGIVFLEAMAAGLPVVAIAASAVPEVVPQGLLVAPGDDQGLAAGIERLYRDEPMRRCLTAVGRERVKEFDAPRVAGTFADEVRRAIRSRVVTS